MTLDGYYCFLWLDGGGGGGGVGGSCREKAMTSERVRGPAEYVPYSVHLGPWHSCPHYDT